MEITVPNPGFAASNEPQFFRVVSTDASGQEGWDEVPVLVPSGNVTGNLTITTDLSGQTFTGGQPIPDMDWTGSVNFGTITPVVVLESDGAGISGLNISGHGVFFQDFPFVSTDRARLALQVRNNSNDTAWFFATGYFSIRHDSRLGFQPPSVNINFRLAGSHFPVARLSRSHGQLLPQRVCARSIFRGRTTPAAHGTRSFAICQARRSITTGSCHHQRGFLMCGSESSPGTFAFRTVLPPVELSASRLRVPHQHRPQPQPEHPLLLLPRLQRQRQHRVLHPLLLLQLR